MLESPDYFFRVREIGRLRQTRLVECLAGYYCVSLVPRPIERVDCCDYLCHAEVKPLSRLSSLTLTAAAG